MRSRAMLTAPVAGGSTMSSHTGLAERDDRLAADDRSRTGLGAGLDVEAEDGGVAILENVLLPLNPHLAYSACLGPAARIDQVFPANHFGFDEAPLEIAVDG